MTLGRRPMPLRAALLAALCVLSLISSANRTSAQTCPASVLGLQTVYPVESFAAIDSAVEAGSGRMVAFDLVHGTLRLAHPGSVGWSHVRAVDRFVVTGLPEGTPVGLTALLDVDGFSTSEGCGGSGCYLIFGARLGDPDGQVERSVESTFAPETVRLVDTLTWPVLLQAGVPHELHYELWVARPPGAAHRGGGTARLHFSALPAGATLTSCHGYNPDGSTGLRPTTWGRIKQIYR